jgi:hypothetical protein
MDGSVGIRSLAVYRALKGWLSAGWGSELPGCAPTKSSWWQQYRPLSIGSGESPSGLCVPIRAGGVFRGCRVFPSAIAGLALPTAHRAAAHSRATPGPGAGYWAAFLAANRWRFRRRVRCLLSRFRIFCLLLLRAIPSSAHQGLKGPGSPLQCLAPGRARGGRSLSELGVAVDTASRAPESGGWARVGPSRRPPRWPFPRPQGPAESADYLGVTVSLAVTRTGTEVVVLGSTRIDRAWSSWPAGGGVEAGNSAPGSLGPAGGPTDQKFTTLLSSAWVSAPIGWSKVRVSAE